MDERLTRGFRLGGHLVTPLAGEVRSPAGTVTHLQPRAMNVLLHLAEKAGQIVTRDELLDAVWQGYPSDEVLSGRISELRRAFADSGRDFIKTHWKVGYVLQATPQPLEEGATVAGPRLPPADEVASVAVLPFDVFPCDEGTRSLGRAIALEVHHALSQLDRLRVAGWGATAGLAADGPEAHRVADALKVQYLVSGSLTVLGETVRLHATVEDVEQGAALIGRACTCRLEELFELQGRLAREVAGAFSVRLFRQCLEEGRAGDVGAPDADVWTLVSQARAHLIAYGPGDLRQATILARQAVAAADDLPIAHATLGVALAEGLAVGLSESPESDDTDCMQAAQTAYGLAPGDPLVLKMVGTIYAYAGDWRRSVQALREAVRRSPFDFGAWGYLGWPLVSTGRAEHLEELQQILDRILGEAAEHPGVSFWRYHRSVCHTLMGEAEQAVESALVATGLNPNFPFAWLQLANALGECAEPERAAAAAVSCTLHPQLTPQAYREFVGRTAASPAVVAARVSGLRRAGLLA